VTLSEAVALLAAKAGKTRSVKPGKIAAKAAKPPSKSTQRKRAA
jgi:hypothetical protein